MADELVEIFNGDVTNANLAAGYNLVVTNSSTTYAIKDVQVSGGYYDSIIATINNTEIGDFSANLSGSEIMGVSSTLQLTADAYNYTNFFLSYYNYVDDKYTDGSYALVNYINGGSSNQTTSNVTLPSSINWTSNSNWCPVIKINSSYYQFVHDGNSSTSVYYWSSATASRTILNNTAYRPFAYGKDRGEVYYTNQNSQLYKHTPSGGSSLITTISESLSSYARAYYLKGWFFYIPSSAYTTDIYAIKVTNGRKVTFNNLDTCQHGNQFQLAVSYDEATDKFYMYRRNESWNNVSYFIQQAIPNVTKTQMDALASNQTYTSVNKQVNTQTANTLLGSDYVYNQFGAAKFYGSSKNGNVLYHLKPSTGSANFITVKSWDYDNGIVNTEFITDISYGDSYTVLAYLDHYVPDSTEIAATNYNPQLNVRLRLTGVKTT
jgi:hypothetical protein